MNNATSRLDIVTHCDTLLRKLSDDVKEWNQKSEADQNGPVRLQDRAQ